MAVLELPDAKAHLNITGDEHDAKLEAMIAAAESAIAERVGPLESTPRTVRVRPYGKNLIIPGPALGLTSVTDSSGATVDTAGLYVEPRSGVVTDNLGASFGASWYDITYDFGRAECPPDLLLAVKEMVRHLWDTQRGPTGRPGANTSATAANTIPGAAYLLPFRVSELIAPHRPALVAG